jgi:hypothetical protein
VPAKVAATLKFDDERLLASNHDILWDVSNSNINEKVNERHVCVAGRLSDRQELKGGGRAQLYNTIENTDIILECSH